jgi:hypothetical protein
MDLEGHLAEHLESIALFVLGAEFDANKNKESGRSWSSTDSELSSQLWSNPSKFLRGSQSPSSISESRLSDIGDDQTLPRDQHRASVDIRHYARPFLNLLRRPSSTATTKNQMNAELQIQRWFEDFMKKAFRIPSGYSMVRESSIARTEAQRNAELRMQRWFEDFMKKVFRIPSGYVTIAVLVISWHDAVDEGHDSEVCFRHIHNHQTHRLYVQVAELKQLLERDFGYKFEEVRLRSSTAKKTQHDLNAAIANHCQKYDSPNSLLITYYTGHGLFRSSGNNRVLELSV